MNGIDWSLLLGVLTLVCWLGAGLTTLFGTTHADTAISAGQMKRSLSR